jgi:hypothetical protein
MRQRTLAKVSGSLRASAAHNACMETDAEIVVVEKVTLPARQGGSVVDPHAARPTKQIITFPDSDDSSEDSSGGGKAHAVEQEEEEEEVVGAVDDFVTIVVFPNNNELLLELVSDLDVDLSNVDQYSTKVFQKRIMDLFKVRRKMKKNMTESGTHDSDPWRFCC